MHTIRTIILSFSLLFAAMSCHNVEPPAPYGPCPTEEQVEWQRMEMNMFCHFGPNTFTGAEWGDGAEPEDIFSPTDLNCRQWASVAKQAGMKGIIITAKHHDGFCLWPNPYSTHTVAQSKWMEGKGDVVQILSDACQEAGLKMGIYVSPWDRNAPTYGTPQYNETFRLTLEDVLSRYGTIFEQWFDGANGEGPNGKRQEYDWNLFNSTVERLQPHTLIFSDVGPGCRWVGNENGMAGETCWSTLNTDGFAPGAYAPPIDTLNQGNLHGTRWVPAETDVSIRPGWFWHEEEEPKSVDELVKIYYNSVGRNSLMLLNVPPDRRGLIDPKDSTRLLEFRRTLDSIFATNKISNAKLSASNSRGGEKCKKYNVDKLTDGDYHTYWATDDSCLTPTLTVEFGNTVTFNLIVIQEYIALGQRIAKFHIDFMNEEGKWQPLCQATTIGYKRILPTATTTAKAIRIHIDQSLACPVLNALAIY